MIQYALTQSYKDVMEQICKSDMKELIDHWTYSIYYYLTDYDMCTKIQDKSHRKNYPNDLSLKEHICNAKKEIIHAKKHIDLVKKEGPKVIKSIYDNAKKLCNVELDVKSGFKILQDNIKEYQGIIKKFEKELRIYERKLQQLNSEDYIMNIKGQLELILEGRNYNRPCSFPPNKVFPIIKEFVKQKLKNNKPVTMNTYLKKDLSFSRYDLSDMMIYLGEKLDADFDPELKPLEKFDNEKDYDLKVDDVLKLWNTKGNVKCL